ncbi:serine hydrolase domain-containing protein [Catenuloplanes japonicus]|uniref:serine hydrolase domain-containing protein n=1 Tax=Catenuloplanes japonicus TaxID=33876 RepID=UPI00054FA030|nr:serine hydrolase domain-containing protein [Catenuloplanes japonicus]
MVPLHGHTSSAFTPVRSAFASLLASGAETGAALTVIHDGRIEVELHGGWRDAARTVPWTADTLVGVYSAGKPVAALCVLLLVARGQLDLDDPVARHWPAFGTAGKTAITVRQLLNHTAGLVAFPDAVPAADPFAGSDDAVAGAASAGDAPAHAAAGGALTADLDRAALTNATNGQRPLVPADLADWDLLASSLAAAPPAWEPGTVAGEFALTYGHPLGELIQRIDGRTLGAFLRDEIALPWGLDLAFGLTPSQIARCADLEYGDPSWPLASLGTPGSWRWKALSTPPGTRDLDVINGPLWRTTEIPAVNLHTTATALARLYANLLSGGAGLFPPTLVAEATSAQYTGFDLVLDRDVTWTLGMQREPDGSWGMGGIGGGCAFAHPTRHYSFAYTTHHLSDFTRVDHLVDVLNALID